MTPKIIELTVAGLPQKEIARELDISESTIKRVLSREESKALIQQAADELLLTLPSAVNIVRTDINLANKISAYLNQTTDSAGRLVQPAWPVAGIQDEAGLIKLYNATYKRVQDVLKAAGILPGATSSVVISNVFNAPVSIELSPVAQRIVDAFADNLRVVDADATDITPKKDDND